MAAPRRKITQHEWDLHADTINDLYHARGLPLHTEKGGQSVLQIMRDDHQFFASPAQYEAYFKKTNRPKNLKKHEWRAVFAKVNELATKGIETRVKVSGQVFSKNRLERSRRYALAGNKLLRPDKSVPALLHPHRITIETLEADGEWSAYTNGDTAPASSQSLPPNDPTILGSGDPWAQEHMPDDEAPFLSSYESPQMALIPSPRNALFHFSNLVSSNQVFCPFSLDPHLLQPATSSHFALASPPANFSSLTPQCWAWESPFFQLQAAVSDRPMQGIHFHQQFPENIGVGRERDSALTSTSRNTPKILVQSLLQDAADILRGNAMSKEVANLPDPEDVLDSLLSLLPESQAQDDSEQVVELTTGDVIFDSTFHRTLLFSIVNGFAGLENVPSGSMLRMLRKQPQMSSRLFDCLRSCPPTLAKPLADNLFRAAVEACDEQAVIIILQATRNSPNAIIPDDIACKFGSDGRLYTPIELAAKFRHLGIVGTLLAANADVNKTYEQSERLERGALELAIRKFGKQDEAVDMKLVLTLLDCHAEVRVDLIEAVIRWRQADLIRELISRFPPASHRSFFKSKKILKDITQYLRNDLATALIKQIFSYCQAENCMRCPNEYSKLMDTTLSNAAMRGNHELVNFLLGYTTNRQAALSAAVRKGNRELIDLFLKHGASIGGPIHFLDEVVGNEYRRSLIPTTPLAEAIRSQDNDLVQEFENLGALSYINQKQHFEAAIYAAAEVGDCSYMQKLLETVPEKRATYLTLALNLAIQNNKTEAALILLDAGADVNKLKKYHHPPPPWSRTLQEALKKKNKAVVEKILESDVNVHLEEYHSVMEIAGQWGDIPIIEDLILMGADIDGGRKMTALGAAVKSKNRVLVDLLINHGANPSKCATETGNSPLKAAVINADDDMMRLLISKGADPANHEVFLSAIGATWDSEDSEDSEENEDNQGTLKVLFESFAGRYPQGKKRFGTDLLIAAIEKGDATLFSNLLAAKMDATSFNSLNQVTALGFAISYRNGREPGLVQQLLNAGGDPNGIVSKPHGRLDEVKPLETALIVAIKTKNEQMVQLLLNYGAEVHRPARRGVKRTPLQQACEIGSFKIVKLLLDNKANVNDPPAERGGGTALQLAAISGSIKIARILLAHGAFVHAPPAKVNGRSAFEGAAEYGRLEMLRELWVAVEGQGFSREQIEKAISLAESRGHRGCAEYIASLSSSADFSTLQVDPFITYDAGWDKSVTPSFL